MSKAKQQQQIKERPIIFSSPMVRAILEGKKTMTRRVIKPQAKSYRSDVLGQPCIYAVEDSDYPDPKPIYCPYGKVGSRLWVRETWYPAFRRDGEKTGVDAGVIYKADYGYRGDLDPTFTCKWKPSIFMPRWASRITLEITDVRVARLREISRADTEAEGVGCDWQPDSNQFATFQRGWDSINSKRGYSWESNPFVWAISFQKVPK